MPWAAGPDADLDPVVLPEARRTLARRIRFARDYAAWRRAVRELWRFKWRENHAVAMVGAYHTRHGGVPYLVRHNTRDIGIFAEIFIGREYEPPAPVAARLDRLGRPLQVLDLGGNVGLFVAFCRERWPGARVTSVEPDPENLELLQRMADGQGDIEVIRACAAAHDGSLDFVSGLFAESHVASTRSAEPTIEVPCVDVFRLAVDVDLVKMDIEGSEWEILRDPRMATIGAAAWVMEWHDKQCVHADPSTAARAALESAGFAIVSERSPSARNGTIWAVRPGW